MQDLAMQYSLGYAAPNHQNLTPSQFLDPIPLRPDKVFQIQEHLP